MLKKRAYLRHATFGGRTAHTEVLPAEGGANGYHMIRCIEIKDFRCFGHIKLGDLSRVNVLTGANATGKSTLLEALYIGANASANALNAMTNIRSQTMAASLVGPLMPGISFAMPIGFQQQGTSIFEAFFRSYKDERSSSIAEKIAISYTDTDQINYNLLVYYDKSNSSQTQVPVVTSLSTISTYPLILDRTTSYPAGEPKHSKIAVTVNQNGQLQQPNADAFGPSLYFFGANLDYSESDNVTWFSQLREKGKSDAIVNFISEEFPFIKGLEVLAPNGSNALYAILADGSRRKVTSVSSGIHKVISILLGCSHINKGIILIDEIENGIFYEKYQAMWRVLYNFAKETDNQIFVSSHSLECLSALVPVMTGHESEFSLIRAEGTDNDFFATHTTGKSMKSALVIGGEIRG